MAACASQGLPPGGPEDQRPPVVISTYPDGFAALDDLLGAVRFEFDERISERASGGTMDEAISISPRAGEVTVKHSRRALAVQVEGGFRPGIVYRVTLQPVVSDMFGNRITDPFELVFTTGAEAVATTLAGEVWDRVTGRPAAEATVLATDRNGLVHASTTSRDGIFAFRYLPAGEFDVVAFDDVNRNGEVDSVEVQGLTSARLEVGDTLLLDVGLLAPDTSAAVVANASPIDSVTFVIEFDDYLDSEAELDPSSVEVTREAGSAPNVVRLFHEADYATWVDGVVDSLTRLDSIDAVASAARAAAAADSAAAARAVDSVAVGGGEVNDTLGAPDATGANAIDTLTAVGAEPSSDSAGAPGAADPGEPSPPGILPGDALVGAPADTAVIADPALSGRPGTGQRQPAASSGRPVPTRLDALQGARPGLSLDGRRNLPARRIVAVISEALEADVEYEVEVSGVLNLNGLAGGGGVAMLLLESPPPDTATVDTAAVVDTATVDTALVLDSAAVPDTAVVIDTATVDTTFVPDSAALPDTGFVIDPASAPDTGAVVHTTRSVAATTPRGGR